MRSRIWIFWVAVGLVMTIGSIILWCSDVHAKTYTQKGTCIECIPLDKQTMFKGRFYKCIGHVWHPKKHAHHVVKFKVNVLTVTTVVHGRTEPAYKGDKLFAEITLEMPPLQCKRLRIYPPKKKHAVTSKKAKKRPLCKYRTSCTSCTRTNGKLFQVCKTYQLPKLTHLWYGRQSKKNKTGLLIVETTHHLYIQRKMILCASGIKQTVKKIKLPCRPQDLKK